MRRNWFLAYWLPMVDIMPEMVASKRSEEGKKAEVEYRAYKDSIKEKGEN